MSVIAGMILGLGFSMLFPGITTKIRQKIIDLVSTHGCS